MSISLESIRGDRESRRMAEPESSADAPADIAKAKWATALIDRPLADLTQGLLDRLDTGFEASGKICGLPFSFTIKRPQARQ